MGRDGLERPGKKRTAEGEVRDGERPGSEGEERRLLHRRRDGHLDAGERQALPRRNEKPASGGHLPGVGKAAARRSVQGN